MYVYIYISIYLTRVYIYIHTYISHTLAGGLWLALDWTAPSRKVAGNELMFTPLH